MTTSIPIPTVRPGLVSVTFRTLTPEQIVALVQRAGLVGIEWGGDVHVPHGDTALASRTRKMTADAGLVVSAYGSYYRCAAPADKTPTWDAVMASAAALGTTTIRVWAGINGSADAGADDRARVIEDLKRICQLAAAQRMTVDLEYHGGTLTDTLASTLSLLQAAGAPNLRTFWQPRHGVSAEGSVADIRALSRWLSNVHVFHWWPTSADRKPLADGVDRWREFLAALPNDGKSRFASLEFVSCDDPEQFIRDARTLREVLAGSSCGQDAATRPWGV